VLFGLLLSACSSSSTTAGAPKDDAAAATEDGSAAAAAAGDGEATAGDGQATAGDGEARAGDGAAATAPDTGGMMASDGDAGTSGARAYVSLGPIGGPSDGGGPCPGSWLKVGTYGLPVTDGATDPSNGAVARVSCSVVATGDAGGPFRLQATIRSTSDGGSTTVTITAPISTGTNPAGISVTIARADGTYSDGNCGVIFSQLGEGVAPGFFWGLLECSGLKNAAQTQTCNAEGQIELNDCSAS
jgi:hypothetical protein